jgi:hypothetical protein
MVMSTFNSPVRPSGWLRRGISLALAGLLLVLSESVVKATDAVPAQPGIQQSKGAATQPTPTVTPDANAGYTQFGRITDTQGVFSIEAPLAWSDVVQGDWQLNGAVVGRRLAATPNQSEFSSNWGMPGLVLNYSTSLPATMDLQALLDAFNYAGSCQDGGRGALPPGVRTVTYQIWQNCSNTQSAAVVLVLSPSATRDYYAVLEVYLAGPADVAALGPILTSVQVGNAGLAAAPAGAPAAAPLAPSPTPPPVATPTPQPPTAQATVLADRLSMRGGPGTQFERLGILLRGVQVTVQGQTGNCAWLRVTTPDGATTWVSGDPQFIQLNAACAAVPVVQP